MKKARVVLEIEVPDNVKQITVDENGTLYGWTKNMRMKPDTDLKIWVTEKEANDCPENQFGEINKIQNWERLRIVPKKSAVIQDTAKKKPKAVKKEPVVITPPMPNTSEQKRYVRKRKG